ncbi:uncharacterized protein K452DRAFT_356538 [Aplosporella prunicola CBS 121167]|uniref:Uncharacterized protein n=1 Tax=Aplosporella prunicola CBS 121167 TaxID=1176127 RepID=A0A6A6BMB4_9PEZI|nr:uncharacterized protein K452DRAFT_356538 [Aplosporella prunicola CBS 121167]KAF2145262.1 hypothetical protein K452DRAFT_356538 [Aplosporella prunicola CBS 121167]
MTLENNKLHWTQRVALIRHNLHAASRTGDFTFFKTLQAHRLLEGTDHMATLTAAIGDAADQVLASLDNYNSVMAYVHEDAFKNVYEGVKAGVRDQVGSFEDRRAIYYVDCAQQKEKAEKAIDKMINSAITMINTQPAYVQEETANIWIWGATFVADAMEVCLSQIDQIECYLDDFIRLENSWAVVQSAVGSSIGAIKGIFNLMAPSQSPELQQRSEQTEGTVRSMLRRMSTAMTSGMNSATTSRRQSTASISAAPPLNHGTLQTPPGHLQPKFAWRPNALKYSGGTFEPLAAIPPTPAAMLSNPFESSAFNASNQHFSVGEDIPPVPTLTFPCDSDSPPIANSGAIPTDPHDSMGPRIISPHSNGSSEQTSVSSTRPRSQNVHDPQPVFDDVLFMDNHDPLSPNADEHMADSPSDAGIGLNSGLFRRLSTMSFRPTAVH